MRSAKSVRYKGILKQHQTRLKKLGPIVQGKALLWCLTPSITDDEVTGRSPSVRRMEQADWTELTGEATDFSVTRPAGSKDSFMVTLEGARGRNPNYNPDSPTLDMFFPTHGRAYVRSIGLDLDGGEWKEIPALAELTLRDIHAVPDDADPQAVRLYWTHDRGSGVSTYSTATRKVTKTRAIGAGGAAIRAVPGRNPERYYVLNNAPDAKGYSTVRTAAGLTVSVPIKSCLGIAVCQTFLWAFDDSDIYCLGHENVGKVDNSAWRKVVRFANSGVQWLSPADDQILIAVVSGRTHGEKWSLDVNALPKLDAAMPIKNGPKKGTVRVQRQPVRAWPLYKAWADNLQNLLASPP